MALKQPGKLVLPRKAHTCSICNEPVQPKTAAMSWTEFQPFKYQVAHKDCYDAQHAAETGEKVLEILDAAAQEIAAQPDASVGDLIRAIASKREKLPRVVPDSDEPPEPLPTRTKPVFDKFVVGQLRRRYWRSRKTGKLYCFSGRPDAKGFYWSWIVSPKGKGARSGQATAWTNFQKPVGFRKKSKAIARARQRYYAEKKGVPDGETQA